MKDNFDVHKWNIQRRLNENRNFTELGIQASREVIEKIKKVARKLPDAAMDSFIVEIARHIDAEPPKYRLEEGINDREVKGKLSDIKYDFLTSYFNGETFHAPNPDDSSRQINDERDWDSWKEGVMKDYGDVSIKLDNTAVWYDRIKILDKGFEDDKDSYVKGKAAFLDRERAAGRTSGLDEGSCGYNRDAKSGKKLKTPGGLKEVIKSIKEAYPGYDINEIQSELLELKELGANIEEKEKKADRCLRVARRKMPKSSAYRSGLIVKCRKGMIWKKES